MFRKKPFLCSVCISLFLLMMSGMAHANLTTIGTAGYDSDNSGTIEGSEWYTLIWDDDNNGNSVVWLDYTNDIAAWDNQLNWASSLNGTGVLTINLYSGYTVNWGSSSWRLPTTVDGTYVYGNDGTTTAGWNITSSEIGHLFYDELGNLALYDTSGNYQSEYGLIETGDFENLIASWYWSGTEFEDASSYAWIFLMNYGIQITTNKLDHVLGIAVRTGEVSVSSTPIPGSILLLSTGILGLAAADRRKGRNI